MTIVLEGRAREGADDADVDGVEVVHAPGEGDDTIAAIAEVPRRGDAMTRLAGPGAVLGFSTQRRSVGVVLSRHVGLTLT